LAFRYALRAARKATDRARAFVALAVSGVAMLFWLLDTIVALVNAIHVFGPVLLRFLKYLA
jgi:hypothetical protein